MDFKEQWLGNFDPDPRDEALRAKIEQAYKETDNKHLSDKFAPAMTKLRIWAKDSGYTRQEVLDAKVQYKMGRRECQNLKT